MEQILSLAVGDLVVYASHGVGRVAARESRKSKEGPQDVVVIEFSEGLSVTLPIERALEYLRPLSSEAQIEFVQRVLQADEALDEEAWQKRLRAIREKVTVGEAVGLAEVVRDGARRDLRLAAGGGARLSGSERQLYLNARRLLVDEIGAARGIDADEADAWITDQLARPDEHADEVR
jgi:CarD family transcriptional regulator